MAILEFINRQRELRSIAKYTKRRSNSSFPVTAIKIPKMHYDWESKEAVDRHAHEYYSASYASPRSASSTRSTSSSSTTSSSSSFSSTCSSRSSVSSTSDCGSPREEVLVVLATEQDENAWQNEITCMSFDPLPAPTPYRPGRQCPR